MKLTTLLDRTTMRAILSRWTCHGELTVCAINMGGFDQFLYSRKLQRARAALDKGRGLFPLQSKGAVGKLIEEQDVANANATPSPEE
jgi:hypothetical protein